jgi:hypothetical protein
VTTHEPICADGEGASLTFDAGDGWDGSCTALATPVSSDAFASVTYQPPLLAPCEPSPTPAPPPIGGMFVRACDAPDLNDRPNNFILCYPPKPNGQCWLGYDQRREFTALLIDHRTCTPCECGAPSGGECTATTTLYEDSECINELDRKIIHHTDQPLCSDVPPGPFGSMRAELTRNTPGACTPSVSRVIGTVERGTEPRVVCCPY